jgi:hypothetical protein
LTFVVPAIIAALGNLPIGILELSAMPKPEALTTQSDFARPGTAASVTALSAAAVVTSNRRRATNLNFIGTT